MPRRFATLLLLSATAALLLHTWPLDLIHFDSTRDLLMARDCYALGRCDSHGPPTSVDGLYQGVLWTNLLALARFAGLTPLAIGHALIGLYVLVLAVTARRFRAHGPMLLVWLATGASLMVPVVLWSPTLFLPAMMLTTWLTLDWLEQPRWPLAVGLGLLWGITLDLYLAAAPLLLVTFALGLRTRRHLQAIAILALAVGVGVVVSPGAWAGALQILVLHRGATAVTASVLLIALAVVVRVPRLNPLRTLALVGLASAVAIGATHQWESRYLMPAFPAVCLLLAGGLPAGRWWRAAGWLIPVIVLEASPRHYPPELTYAHAAQLADRLSEAGVGWPEALAHVQGPLSRALAPATAVYLPAATTPWQGQDVVVAFRPALHLTALYSRLDLTATELCRDAACAPLVLDPTPLHSAFPFAVRGDARVIRPVAPAVHTLRLRVPLRAGGRVQFQLFPQFEGDTCPWRFGGDRDLLTLPAAATVVTMERRLGPPECPDAHAAEDWLPPWQEVALEPNVVPVQRPRAALLNKPVLVRGLEANFNRVAQHVAAELHAPEPDITLSGDHARVDWPRQPPQLLTYAPERPWFALAPNGADAVHGAALRQALGAVFIENPWQDAQPSRQTPAALPESRWPSLVLAALGLLTLLVGAFRAALTPTARPPQCRPATRDVAHRPAGD